MVDEFIRKILIRKLYLILLFLLDVLMLDEELLLINNGEVEGLVYIILIVILINLIPNQHWKHSQIMLLA